jgi:ABC-type multidrug transport system fused ATPase/permease subunit
MPVAQKLGSWNYLRDVLGLMEEKDRKKIVFLGLIQFCVSMLDLFALLLIGLVTSLSLSDISVQPSSSYVKIITNLSIFRGLDLKTIIFILGGISAILLILKTAVSAMITRKIIGFLSIREAAVSSRYMDEVLSLSPLDQRRWSPQYISGVALTGANCAITITLGQIVNGIVECLSILLLFLGVTVVNPSVTFSTVIYFSSLAYFSTKYLGKKIRFAGQESYRLGISSTELIQNSISTAREVYTSHTQKNISMKFSDQRFSSYKATRSKAFIGLIPKFIFEVGLVLGAIFICTAQIYFYDAHKAITGMVVFLALTSRLVPSLLKIQNSLLELRAANSPTINFLEEFAKAKSLRGQRDEALAVAEAKIPAGEKTDVFTPAISCQNIFVKYPDSQSPTLKGIDLEIPAGSFVAIVGPSGAGKTTLVDALLGIAIPTEGFVTISGVSSNAAMEKWPDKVKYVPQDVQLVSGTIRENICWPESTLNISDLNIQNVLRLVELTEWLEDQSEGLDTKIGLGGSNLSGGQKQRLGIARALVKKPQILILDESTSSLDTETESLISNRILRNMDGLTRVVIAHRLSTVIHADKLVYLENGFKVGEGTYDKLRELVPQFDKNAIANGT